MTEPDNQTATGQPVAISSSVRSCHAALRLAKVLGMLTILLGLSVLAGWALHIESLKTVLPGYVSMAPNTALCFTLSGMALLIGYLSRPRAWKKTCASMLAMLVILIGGATLAEYPSHQSPGLDQWLFTDSLASAGEAHPGRMAPQTTIAFLLFGSALILLSRGPRAARAAQALALAGLFIALLALIGYLFNAQVFISFFSLTPVAIPTIAGFWLLGVAILCARPKKASWPSCWRTIREASSRGG